MKPILEIHDIHKKFKIGAERRRYPTLRESLINSLKFKKDQHNFMWALKGISFDVQQGDVVGIVGKNGSGKSTLLKVLSRITPPTKGYAISRGRMASLLEVGTGFHPELTGRENVFFNGALLGLSRQEIQQKYDEIVSFSGIEKFLETPVKHYSSGMQVRLAFAVAAHLEPDILVIDEVLAVGDAEFKKKCMAKMHDVTQSGRTILFVSHDMGSVLDLCNKGILLQQGTMVMQGSIQETVNQYIYMRDSSSSDLAERTDRQGNGTLRFTEIRLIDPQGNESDVIQTGQSLSIRLKYQTHTTLNGLTFNIIFHDHSNECIFECSSNMSSGVLNDIVPSGEIVCHIPKFPLLSGSYQISIQCRVGKHIADWVWDVAKIEVLAGDFFGNQQIVQREQQSIGKQHVGQMAMSPILVDHQWQF